MSNTRFARGITAAGFIPTAALGITHGIVSGSPAPAVGVVPMLFSSGLGIVLLLAEDKQRKRQPISLADDLEDQNVLPFSAGLEGRQRAGRQIIKVTSSGALPPALVVFFDIILAGSLMCVLVVAWKDMSQGRVRRDSIAALSAYATMPLIINW